MGFYTVLLVIHSIIVLFLIMMILVQRTDSDGMGGLGGGGGGNQFLTGRGAANLMTRTTAILAGAFMITSLVLAILAGRMSEGSILDTPTAVEEKAAPVAKESAPAEEPKAKKEAPKPAVPKPE